MEDEKRLFPIIKKMGDIERPLCPGTPQGSAWYQIETSEVIRMIKCGGQCYWSSRKVRFTAYVGEGWDFDRKLSRQWIAELKSFERECVDPSWMKPEIHAVLHDRNMCFLVKHWRGFTVHWEWAGNHLLPRCTEIREESWVLEEYSWCVIIPGLGRSSRVLAAISHFLQHSFSGSIPVIIPSLRWCSRGKDEPSKKRSHKGIKTSPPDPGLGVLWWMVIVQTGCFSESHRVCAWWSRLWSFELDLPSRNLWDLPGTGPTLTPWPSLPTHDLSAFCFMKNFSLLGLPWVPKNKFNQRDEKIQKQRKTVKQDKTI